MAQNPNGKTLPKSNVQDLHLPIYRAADALDRNDFTRATNVQDFVDKRGKTRQLAVTSPVRVRSYQENLVRIEQMCDPIAFLSAVVRGDLFEEHVVHNQDDGTHKVTTSYVQPTLGQRIFVAKVLADKVVPKLNVSKNLDNKDEESKTIDAHSWESIVEKAAKRVINQVHPPSLPPMIGDGVVKLDDSEIMVEPVDDDVRGET